VDAHTHLVFAGNRAAEFEQRIAGATYQQIAASGGGILRTVELTRAASEDELLAESRKHRDWMLRSGTTTMEAKSGYGLEHATELKMLRVMKRLNEEGPAARLCLRCWRRILFRRSLPGGARSMCAGLPRS
jgi:imidazolonepropionase